MIKLAFLESKPWVLTTFFCSTLPNQNYCSAAEKEFQQEAAEGLESGSAACFLDQTTLSVQDCSRS
jgi:hypothetical protein